LRFKGCRLTLALEKVMAIRVEEIMDIKIEKIHGYMRAKFGELEEMVE